MPVLDRFRLDGRTAVVTGSTRGLGRAFALALAEAGANIVVVGRDAEAAAETTAALAATGARTLTVLADVTVRADLERVLSDSVEEFARVDVLVNNAGACVHRPALEVTDEEWRSVLDVNLTGVWMASQVFGAHMIDAGGGTIVNIGSMSAVHHLTRSLAAEWAPFGVRVNALAPGYMHTDMSPVDDPRFQRYWIQDAPQQRAGEPDELGPAIVFLASDASSFMTGSVLTVDGGYTVF